MHVDDAPRPVLPSSLLDAKRWAVIRPISESWRGPFDIVAPSASERRQATVPQNAFLRLEEAVDQVERRDDGSGIGVVFDQQDDRVVIEWSVADAGSHLYPQTDVQAMIRELDSFTEVLDETFAHTIVETDADFHPIQHRDINIYAGASVVPIWSLIPDGQAHPRIQRTIKSISREELRDIASAVSESTPDFDSEGIPDDLWVIEPVVKSIAEDVQPTEQSPETIIELAKADEKTGNKFRRLIEGHPSPLKLESDEKAPQTFMNLLAFWFRYDAAAMRQQYLYSARDVDNPVLADGSTLVEHRIARAIAFIDRVYDPETYEPDTPALAHKEYKMGRVSRGD